MDDLILRKELIFNDIKNPEILKNIEQIKYLSWYGEYDQNKRKIGKWKAYWNGNELRDVGGYYQNGLKQGLWKELFKNYWNQAQVYEIGEYFNDQKRGRWNFIYENKKIGFGSYKEQGLKEGKWKELSDKFWEGSQVTYDGEYQNGKKVGKWDIQYQNTHDNKQIGGGFYHQGPNEIKIGTWIEISNGFWRDQQITNKGLYKYGKKVGLWDIWYQINFGIKKYFKIGDGSYDEEGDEIKNGKWIELSDGFRDYSQIIHKGRYKNGKKIGRWRIYWRFDKYHQIGGGQYDQEGNGMKIGDWIEESDGFWRHSFVTYNGKYQNGEKVGRWDTKLNTKQIGGGFYSEKGDGMKMGRWIELRRGFWRDLQVIYDGEYKNGNKVGRWDILFLRENEKEFTKIGGGSYEESGNGYKIGKWIDLSYDFEKQNQIIYCCEYNNNKIVGKQVKVNLQNVVGETQCDN
ncbi:unnamed protein product [Paramecium primaurelia]|uniref:MORN repeat protein n=1 Tax=Paramecium primaurelia TaxID=5886 RepID=A0A8S1MPY8_PARPR|nr:unnamed protein product [Paramecium primaurelia]